MKFYTSKHSQKTTGNAAISIEPKSGSIRILKSLVNNEIIRGGDKIVFAEEEGSWYIGRVIDEQMISDGMTISEKYLDTSCKYVVNKIVRDYRLNSSKGSIQVPVNIDNPVTKDGAVLYRLLKPESVND